MTVVRLRARCAAFGRTPGSGLLAVAVMVSAGCGGGEPADRGAGTGPPASPSPPPPTAPPGRSAASSATDGCPVDPATLFAALKANRELYGAVDAGISGLRDPSCHRGYATATTIVPPEQADPAFVVFRYDPARTGWTALGAGTDAVCTDLVPADIIARLSGCIGS